MAVFNVSQNITGMPDVFDYLNVITQNWFGTMVLLVIGIGTFIFGSQKNFSDGLIVSGFITAVIAILMRVSGLVGDKAVIIPIVIFIIGLGMGLGNKPSMGG